MKWVILFLIIILLFSTFQESFDTLGEYETIYKEQQVYFPISTPTCK